MRAAQLLPCCSATDSKCRHILTDDHDHCPAYVWYAAWIGGKEEAEMHYEEAMTAVFSLQLKRHYHVQPYRSSKDGKQKWANMEMWPMPVSVHP